MAAPWRGPSGVRVTSWQTTRREGEPCCDGGARNGRRSDRLGCRLLQCMSPFVCRFSDAGNCGSIHTRGRPASEKRQGRKSRSVVQRRCGVGYGDLATGLELMGLDRSRCGGRFAVNRGWWHRGEGAIGTVHDGICGANTGQCRGRMRACLRPAASQRGRQVW